MIKLTHWQRLKRWGKLPYYEKIAIDACDDHADIIRNLPFEEREKFWNRLMDDNNIDILLRYVLEKDHKEHFVGPDESGCMSLHFTSG